MYMPYSSCKDHLFTCPISTPTTLKEPYTPSKGQQTLPELATPCNLVGPHVKAPTSVGSTLLSYIYILIYLTWISSNISTPNKGPTTQTYPYDYTSYSTQICLIYLGTTPIWYTMKQAKNPTPRALEGSKKTNFQFWSLILVWCRLQSPTVDPFFGSFQGAGL